MSTSLIPIDKDCLPGYPGPKILVGSQTIPPFRGDASEQSYEGFYSASANKGDILIVRNFPQVGVDYLQNLFENPNIINIEDPDGGDYLTTTIRNNPQVVDEIQSTMQPDSKLLVFTPTPLEEELADHLGVPLHGSAEGAKKYGTKDGVRTLAKEEDIPMAPGFICTSPSEINDAFTTLQKMGFDASALKRSDSLSGYFSKKVDLLDNPDAVDIISDISEGNSDVWVVEGWVKSKASLCAHIEVSADGTYRVGGIWGQLLDTDGITYIGAKPTDISEKEHAETLRLAHKLGKALAKRGAVGSHGPDINIVADDETHLPPGTAFLIENNARTPYTAAAIEAARTVKGTIGTGFQLEHLKVPQNVSLEQVLNALQENGLLITKKDSNATGIIPYSFSRLPYGEMDAVALAEDYEGAKKIMDRTRELLTKI